jgi:hypothetical protein
MDEDDQIACQLIVTDAHMLETERSRGAGIPVQAWVAWWETSDALYCAFAMRRIAVVLSNIT